MENSEIIEYILGAISLVFLFVVLALISILYSRGKLQRAKQTILETEIEHRKEVVKRMLETQENERYEISGKLHDEVGSKLSSIRMVMYRCKPQLHQEEYRQLESTLNDVIEVSRDISHRLASFTLSKLGFEQAIKELLHAELEKNGYQVNFSSNIDSIAIPLIVQRQLFRVLQELVTNSLKHSKGNRIVVQCQLLSGSHQWSFEYKDIGNSYPIKLQYGFGLNSIERRIESINGQHELNYCKSSDFSLKILIPIHGK